VAREREIVIEERLQTAEDDIDGQLDELVYGQAFRVHPYRWPIVGRMVDIQAATLARVAAFHRRYYAAARAVIVVAGRFDPPAALASIVAAYGALPGNSPSDPPPASAISPERAPEREVRATITRAVPAERLMVGYPAPSLGDPDRATYELMDELLTGGPSSRLSRALMVDRALASSLDTDVAPTRDPGLWTIVVQMQKGEHATAALDLIRRAITRLIDEPPPAPEIAAARNRLETAFWSGLASSQARAELLAHFDVATGDFRHLIERGGAYARVSASDVSRVARAYLGTGARSVVVARPKDGVLP
jgi:zinc protease